MMGCARQWTRHERLLYLSRMKLPAFVCHLGFCFFMAAMAPASGAAEYGTKVALQKDRPVAFPDFVLTYLGERRVASERFPRGFVFRDFRVAGAVGTQTVSWSAGTGDIGPALFRAGPKSFALELQRSDKLGPLKSDEIVISRAP
jgi:hypothetical protein